MFVRLADSGCWLAEPRVPAGSSQCADDVLPCAFTVWCFVLQAFWLPSQQSESKDLMQKPDSATYCPASGKKLRLKDCVAVKFTRVREGESGLYMDPVTLETFTNASKLVVIAPTGEQGTSAARHTHCRGLMGRC